MKKRLAQYQRLADYAVIGPGGVYHIFGHGIHDAVVIVGTHREKLKKVQVLLLDAKKVRPNEAKRKSLLSDVKRFEFLDAGELIASFSLLSQKQSELREAISATDSTHIEFNIENCVAKAFVFDVRAQDGNVLWKSSFTAISQGLELNNCFGKSSSFVMKSDTFLRLPKEAYAVSLYEDYAIFSASTDGTQIYIHDQNIRKPYTVFVSDRLETTTTFLFHPKS
jgi:hypothetical protein